MLDIKRMQYLEAIYQYGNFTKASEALFVSQPTLSNAVHALESELGMKLMSRNAKGVFFTYEGRQVMQRIIRILDLYRETEIFIRDLSDSAGQRLQLGVSAAMSHQIVPAIFSDFAKLYPHAQICLNEGSMNKHLDMIRCEQLDLAYNGLPEGSEAEGLITIPVTAAEIHAVLPPAHPLAGMVRIPLRLLSKENLIMMDTQSKVNELISAELERQHLISCVLFHYDQISCMADLVKNCGHVGVISVARGQEAIGCENLTLRPLEEALVFDVGFIYKRERYLPQIGRKLIKFIQSMPL